MTDCPVFVLAAPRLSNRQTQVLGLAAQGYSDSEIGWALALSVHTVREHLERARARLGARNTTHAVALAIVRGLIPVDAFTAQTV